MTYFPQLNQCILRSVFLQSFRLLLRIRSMASVLFHCDLKLQYSLAGYLRISPYGAGNGAVSGNVQHADVCVAASQSKPSKNRQKLPGPRLDPYLPGKRRDGHVTAQQAPLSSAAETTFDIVTVSPPPAPEQALSLKRCVSPGTTIRRRSNGRYRTKAAREERRKSRNVQACR